MQFEQARTLLHNYAYAMSDQKPLLNSTPTESEKLKLYSPSFSRKLKLKRNLATSAPLISQLLGKHAHLSHLLKKQAFTPILKTAGNSWSRPSIIVVLIGKHGKPLSSTNKAKATRFNKISCHLFANPQLFEIANACSDWVIDVL